MTPDKPTKKTFKVYDYHELRDYLIKTKAISENEADEFWHWWIDLRDHRTGPMDGAIRMVPLGFWGWTEKAPYRQLSPDLYYVEKVKERAANGDKRPVDAPTDRDRLAYNTLCALERFKDGRGDLRVWMEW